MARKGLPLTEYGIVCARTAKMQRLSMGDASCPLPLALIDEFEAFTRRFRMDVHGAQGAWSRWWLGWLAGCLIFKQWSCGVWF